MSPGPKASLAVQALLCVLGLQDEGLFFHPLGLGRHCDPGYKRMPSLPRSREVFYPELEAGGEAGRAEHGATISEGSTE